ncbi:putative clathrin assembly protein At2g01600 isoform X2 [Amaranthus tricolor]|uniref:putative clathrin assembly protein At2g01600 isoform X2 n=1 Tax=Amaranthus tricolor TaxID=29722 RepID=UPI00258C0BF5|nr:putative clathrin assembly protein At2g01600 isoform X2 [Amaranthus tricolor]
MATLTWRKAYGAIKDQTKVGLAQINSDYKDLDVAIVKATNHVECPPKERHLRKILIATSAIKPRADVAYCLHALARRLAKTRNWTVALKTLIVIHRLLREGDITFREELLTFSQRGRVLQLSNFKDDSGPIAWDCSAWVRTYALFLEERLECFRVLTYDIEAERLPKPAQGQEKGYSLTRDLNSEKLLEQLPALQQLLYRLFGCRPEGAANGNYVIQYALALVLKESFKIYCAINDGIINLVDKFFEMPRHEAVKALEIYRRAGQQAASLSDFYEVCKGLELARNFQFPALREPPQTFLATMEEYIREAPKMVTIPTQQLELPERLLLTYKPEENSLSEDDKSIVEEPQQMTSGDLTSSAEAAPTTAPPPAMNLESDDLLGLNDVTHDASVIEESNALALAIVSDAATTSNNGTTSAKEFDPTGWELALVTTPSTDVSAHTERQLAGGLDSLTLNSLYDEGAYRASQQPVYGTPAPNPFEVHDPFAMSNNIAPPAAVQMISQQPQINPFGPYQAPFHAQSQPPVGLAAPNPFVDMGFGPYAGAPVNHPQHPANPFGNTGLL